jgi:hypothetical protein
MHPRTDRRGMALPITILMILLLSVIVAAAFTRISSERRVNGDLAAVVDAQAIAVTGLEQYAASVTAAPGATVVDTVTGIAGGTAYINMWRLRAATPTSDTIYAIVSRGLNTSAQRTDANAPVAERTVARFAVWQTPRIGSSAAWTSITGLDKNGNSGALDGTDHCGYKPTVAGVAVPANPGMTGQQAPATGSPNIATLGADVAAAAAAVPIDWDGIINHNLITPTITITSGTTGWPSSASWSNPNYYPIIMVKEGSSANFDLPSDGRGLLIIQGNLTIGGSQTWKGVVLVGGIITSNGNNTVYGSVTTGLNVKLGLSVPQQAIGNGTKTYQYDSCEYEKTMRSFAKFVTLRNGMVDNWPTY